MEYTMAELAVVVEEAGLTAWSAILNPNTGKYRLYKGGRDEVLEAMRMDLDTTRSQFEAALALSLRIPRDKLKEMSE